LAGNSGVGRTVKKPQMMGMIQRVTQNTRESTSEMRETGQSEKEI